MTVVYSTEGVLGIGYTHNCECRRGINWSIAAGTQTSGERLTREEIEQLPRLAELVAAYT